MKFSIKIEDLRYALSSLSPIIPKKHTIKEATNVMVFAKDGEASLTGYSGVIQKTVRVPCETSEDIGVLFDFSKMNNLSKVLPDGKNVVFTVKDNKITVTCGKSRSTLALADISAYPSMKIGDLTVVSHDTQDIAKSIDLVVHASDRDNAKHEIKGVAIISGEKTIDVVATNGSRLSLCRLPSENESEFSMIIPHTSVGIVSKSLADATNVGTDKNNIVVAGDDFLLVCSLFNGKYVPYDRVIPKDDTVVNKLTFSKENMVNALKRILVITENSFSTTCLISADTGDVDAIIQGSDTMGAKDEIIESIPMTNNGDEAFSVGFNPRFIMDVLSSIDSETINCTIHSGRFSMLRFTDENFTGIITQKVI